MRRRPQVHRELPLSAEQVLARLRDALDHKDAVCDGVVGANEVSLTVREADRRVWSPWVSLEVRAADGGSTLHGNIGPNPSLWGLFVAIYATLVFGAIAGTVYAFVQWTLGWPPTGAWAATGALVALSGACGVDLLGRNKSQGQRDTLHAFIDASLAVGE